MNGNSFVGEVRLYAGDKVPDGWLLCDGSSKDINRYYDLYATIGETFGGDGHSSFNVPDLRGRVPVHMGNLNDTVKLNLADKVGSEMIELTAAHLPKHNHDFYVTEDKADSVSPDGAFIATTLDGNKAELSTYAAYDDSKKIQMNAASIASAGVTTKVSTVQSFIAINYIICYEGAMTVVENYIGEVKLFPLWNDRLAKDWIPCNGQMMQINSGTKDLAGILKTQYGGDGTTNFGIPDLRGRVPVGGVLGDPLYSFGKKLGVMQTNLDANNMPPHRHGVKVADGDGTQPSPLNNFLANVVGAAGVSAGMHYLKNGKPSGNLSKMDSNVVGNTGNGSPISNVQPVLGFVFAIAPKGIYPSKS